MEDWINSFFRVVNKVLSFIGGTALSLMMFLTVADVIMRAGGHPILGTYEMVALMLAVVIGFTIPMVSLDRGHVYMEIVLDKLSTGNKALMNTFTRILCLVLFIIIGYNLIMVGNELRYVRGSFLYIKDTLLPNRLRSGGLLLHRVSCIYLRYRKNLEGPI